MNTEELYRFGTSCEVINQHFIGVFPSDYLSYIRNHPTYPMSAIINLDNSTRPGTHWVAVYFKSRTEKEYMDSFGFPPPPVFYSILSPFCLYNQTLLQNPISTLCGGYCLYYLFHRSIKDDMTSVLSPFSTTDFLYNDSIVQDFMKHRFDYDIPLLNFDFFVK